MTDVLARLLDAIDLAVIATDLDGTVTYWSRGAADLYGWSSQECVGWPVLGLTPTSDSRTDAEAIMTDIQSGAGWRGTFPVRRKDGTSFTAQVTLSPLRDETGRLVGVIGVSEDVTALEEAESQRAALLVAERRAHAVADAASERLAFLADTGEVLAQTTLDLGMTLQRVADLVVARLADWCTIDLVDEDTAVIRRAIVSTAAAGADDLVDKLTRMPPYDPHSPGGVPLVIRTGEPALFADITDDMLQASARDETHLAVLRAIGMTSSVIVPLRARGRITGALTIVSTRPERRYDADDVTLAGELARRAAIAIDNAQLYAERAAVATTLQRSLLPPELPAAPGLEIAARYRPGRRGLDIGGDFYDVFQIAPDTWCLVMGDVCGKGADAAALTGAVRWTVRAVATRELDPQRIVRTLNDTLLAEPSHNRFCTIVVAIARVADGEVRLSVGNGGHPPPLVRRSDGRVERGAEGGMLVGTLPEIDVASYEDVLLPGDTLVFYTDGVTEARAGDSFFGDARLADVVAASGGGTASATADAIDAAVTAHQAGTGRDDLAVLVVRATGPTSAVPAATPAVAL